MVSMVNGELNIAKTIQNPCYYQLLKNIAVGKCHLLALQQCPLLKRSMKLSILKHHRLHGCPSVGACYMLYQYLIQN